MPTGYFKVTATGALIERVTPDGVPADAPPGTTQLTQTQYNTELSAINSAKASARAAVQTAESNNAQADYNALVSAGIPAATAKRLTGWTGP